MLDYEKLGLRCGIEVHRQLDTKKLFCRCNSILLDKEPDFLVKRYLRAVRSEFGEIDPVAEYELSKGRYCIYEVNSDNNCLVELDELPPEPLNQEALNTALEVTLLLKAQPVDEIQVMRKQVIDYSNTSSFQRTVLIAINGHIDTKKGKVRIKTITLEEDAARKIRETPEYIVYRLDRLGIPLIEISTAPDINNPEQAKEAAEYIGMVLKSTGKVKSGIGTVRQDLNVSISKGARVEIKGVQELNQIPDIIKKEVERQLEIIKKKKKVFEEVRYVNPDNTTSYLRPMPGAARMYPETDIPAIEITKEMLAQIKLPELIIEKIIKLEQTYNINTEIAEQIIKESKQEVFENFVRKYSKIEPKIIAQTLILTVKDIKSRHELDADKLKNKDFDFVFSSLNNNEITKEAIPEILIDILEGNKINLKKYQPVSYEDVEKEIKDIIKKNKKLTINAVMGMIMEKHRGKVEGKKVIELIKKYVK